MAPRKHDGLSDLTWLRSAEPSAENLVRVEKLRTVLVNSLAMVDGIISTWRPRAGASGARAETFTDAPREQKHTVESLIANYKSSTAYRSKRYSSRQQTDSLCGIILSEMGPMRIADITADYMRDQHAKWVARAAMKGKGDGTPMGHAMITQLRTVVNYGAKEQDADCLRLSFILRNLGLKVVKHRKGKPLNVDQVRAIIRTANEMGWPSIALAQAFQFECGLRQRDVIGEWVPIEEKGASELIADGMKWLRGIRWNEIDENMMLTHTTSKLLKSIKINLKNKPLVMAELDRFKPLPRSGPVIANDHTNLPWVGHAFRATWRQIARAAQIPDTIQNMDSRSTTSPRTSDTAAASQEAAN